MSLTHSALLVAVFLLAGAALLIARTSALSGLMGKISKLTAGEVFVPAIVFVLVTFAGVAASFQRDAPMAQGERDMLPVAHLHAGGNDDALSRLKDYASSTGEHAPPALAATEPKLPDVDTMIERLKERLEAKPDDAQGWQMLGWSYFHTQRYEQAAEAYSKALEIDPDSSDLKLAREEAKKKAAGTELSASASSSQEDSANYGGEGTGGTAVASSETTAPHQREAEIRSMIDGLSARLESTPRDVEGWTQLIRVRTVLGEKEKAETALSRALDIFKDDSASSGKIIAAAMELGLKLQ